MSAIDYAATFCTGQLTLNSVLMHNTGFSVLDCTPLWMPAAIRGEDRRIPGVPGVRAYRRRRDVTQRELPMAIIGEYLYSGAEQTDFWEGLEANLDYLRTNVIDPTNVGDGTITGSLVMPSGEVRTAHVHVLGLERNSDFVDAGALYTLTLSVPHGTFEVGGS